MASRAKGIAAGTEDPGFRADANLAGAGLDREGRLDPISRQQGRSVRGKTNEQLREVGPHGRGDEKVGSCLGETRQRTGHMAVVSDQGMAGGNPCAGVPE